MAREVSSDNSLALERMRAEARRRADEVSRDTAEAVEKTQTRNLTAGYGGENTVGYLTGDGDVVGTTGQVTPILDDPHKVTVSHSHINAIESMAASTRTDQAAGSLMSVSSMLEKQKDMPPEAVTEIQKRMGVHALQLIAADDADPAAIQRIEGQIGKMNQMLASGTVDISEMDSVMMGLDAEFSSNSLRLRGSFQEHVHKKLEVLRTLRPLLNHMIDDASNGFMGSEWRKDGLNQMLKAHGIDLELSPEQLQIFTELVDGIDGDKGAFHGKNNEEQRQIFMEEAVVIILGAMNVDIPIDVESFSKKAIDVFKHDRSAGAHYSTNGNYRTSEAENRMFERLLVEELGAGAKLAAQHQQDSLNETGKVPRMI